MAQSLLHTPEGVRDIYNQECAEKMVVSRTTVQRIYKSARSKLAKMLVEGVSLKIEGGSYSVSES